jgi:1-acyl-sn-glycerol-3-phosphate acyltransferase
MNKVSQYIRSAIFFLIMPPYVFAYSIVCVGVWLLPLKTRTPIVTWWMHSVLWLLKVICKVNYSVEGTENIPLDRNGIIFSKHQSAWETYFLPRNFDRTAIIAKRELLWIPFFGWGLACLNPITINRSDKANAMAQIIKKGTECLQQGRWVLIFPEGTRVAAGEVGHYRLGGARLAAATGYPLLPVAHNTGRYWPKRTFLKRPGTLRIVYGPLIETKGRSAEEILMEAKTWIENKVAEIDVPDLP